MSKGKAGVAAKITHAQSANFGLRINNPRDEQLQQAAILNSIPDIAWLKDKDSRFIAVNESFAKSCGLPVKSLVGKTDLDIWPKGLADKYRLDDQEVIRTGKRKCVEEELVDASGKISLIETIKTPVFNHAGAITGTVGIARDITDRKKTEERLKEIREELEIRVRVRTAELTKANAGLLKEISERKKAELALAQSQEKFRAILDYTYDWEYWQAVGGEIVYISPSCERISGYPQEAFIADKGLLEKIVHPDDLGWLREKIKVAIKDCVKLEVDFRILTSDGQVRWVSHVCTPFYNAQGELLGRRASNRDITGKKKAEDELNKYKNQLEEIIRQRTQVLEAEIAYKKLAQTQSNSLRQQIEFILGATKTGLDIIDSNYYIHYVNSEWAKKYGDFTGKKCFEYFMGREQPCPECAVRKALETKRVVVSEEILEKEGNRPIQVTTIPFRAQNGEWMVAELNVDMTERRKIDDDLRR